MEGGKFITLMKNENEKSYTPSLAVHAIPKFSCQTVKNVGESVIMPGRDITAKVVGKVHE